MQCTRTDRGLSHMLREYFVWWARQMRDLSPLGLRFWHQRAANALLIEPDDDAARLPSGFSVRVRRDDRTLHFGRFDLDAAGLAAARRAAAVEERPMPISLRLPAGILLEKQLVMPLAAEPALERALAYEMDQETPFSADEVWWDWRIVRRDRQRGQLHLVLFLIPKTSTSDLIEALARGGLAPAIIETESPGGEHYQIMLDSTHTTGNTWSGPMRPLMVACLALALIAVLLPFVRQSLALSRVEARISRLQPEVDQVQRLRRSLESVSGIGAASAAGQAGGAEILKVLAKTTDILPDDTHLTELTLHGRKLGISGQSAGAAKLIGLLAADPFFKDPAFVAAVTRVQGTKLDAFSISTEVRP